MREAVEQNAFACSRGTASRRGDTLRIRLDNRRDTAIANTTGEAALSYQYLGRIKDFHLIKQTGGEHPPYFLFLDPRSGQATQLPGPPIVAPGGERFAAAIPEWDCAESPDQRLEIWRFADSALVQEWRVAELHCNADDRRAVGQRYPR